MWRKENLTQQSVGSRVVIMKVAQSCPTLCDPMDYTVHGILQARILEWVVFPFSSGSSQPRDQTQVSCIAGRFFTSWATREAQEHWSGYPIPSSVDLLDPGIELGSPALQVDSLPKSKSSKIVFTDVFYLVDMSQFIHSSWKAYFKKCHSKYFCMDLVQMLI